jgi:hypothetical protein
VRCGNGAERALSLLAEPSLGLTASIGTTEMYADYDMDQWSERLANTMLEEDE